MFAVEERRPTARGNAVNDVIRLLPNAIRPGIGNAVVGRAFDQYPQEPIVDETARKLRPVDGHLYRVQCAWVYHSADFIPPAPQTRFSQFLGQPACNQKYASGLQQ
jgi:hypothetical protein